MNSQGRILYIFCENDCIYHYSLYCEACEAPFPKLFESITSCNQWNNVRFVVNDSGTGASPIFAPVMPQPFFQLFNKQIWTKFTESIFAIPDIPEPHFHLKKLSFYHTWMRQDVRVKRYNNTWKQLKISIYLVLSYAVIWNGLITYVTSVRKDILDYGCLGAYKVLVRAAGCFTRQELGQSLKWQ